MASILFAETPITLNLNPINFMYVRTHFARIVRRASSYPQRRFSPKFRGSTDYICRYNSKLRYQQDKQ